MANWAKSPYAQILPDWRFFIAKKKICFLASNAPQTEAALP